MFWGLLLGVSLAAWPDRLDERVHESVESFSGELSLLVRDVETGEEYSFDADRSVYLSSVIKLAVALEVFRRIDEGSLSLEERVLYGAEDFRDGVGPLRKAAPGTRLSVRRLLELMLVRSDNAAADLLMGLVGLDEINAGLKRRGIKLGRVVSLLDERHEVYGKLDPEGGQLLAREVQKLGRHDSLNARAAALATMVGRKEPFTGQQLADAFLSFYKDNLNSGSMREVGQLLEQVARCDGLAPSSCGHLQRLMRACETGSRRIAAGLPKGAKWGHKTGTQHARACDVGILQRSGGRSLVIAACVRDFRTVSEAERLLAKIGEEVHASFCEGGERCRGSRRNLF